MSGFKVKLLAPDWRFDDPKLGREVDVEPIADDHEDSGRRLYVLEDTLLYPFVRTKIPHGIAVRPRKGYETQIRPRSSSGLRGLSVDLGTVDAGYIGELSSVVEYRPQPFKMFVESRTILAFNPEPLLLRKGDRVSQLVEVAIISAGAAYTVVDELPTTQRGDNAFGSTSMSATPVAS